MGCESPCTTYCRWKAVMQFCPQRCKSARLVDDRMIGVAWATNRRASQAAITRLRRVPLAFFSAKSKRARHLIGLAS